MSDLERVTLICVGRYGPQVWTDIWADVRGWQMQYPDDWEWDDFADSVKALIKADYVESIGIGSVLRLTPRGEGYREAMESYMAAQGMDGRP